MKTAAVLSITIRQSLVTLLLTSLLLIFGLLFLTKIAHAQACTPDQTLPAGEAIDEFNKCAIEQDVYDDKIFNFNQIAGTSDSLYTMLLGESLLHPETNTVTARSGAVSVASNLVAGLYSAPPVSGVAYIQSQIQKFNPIQPAYAQEGGIGYDLLRPVQRIWTAFRNASYVGFVIVFVIIGFMVMFRAHISPQAVATVQDSIPRLVVALVLVTFSYAIAGLMLDAMFLLLNVAINLLVASGAGLDAGGARVVFEKSIFSLVFSSWGDIFSSVSSAVENILESVIQTGVLGKIIGFLGGTVIGIIAGFAMLIIMVRVFVMLLMAYVMIIILTMASPFFFLIQALPGNNGAKEWFKQMAANISVFPTVALMILFAGMLGGLSSLGGTGATDLSATQVGAFPLLSGTFSADAVGKLIALGFLLMTPEAANLVKNFIGTKGGPQLGGAGAAALAAGAGLATWPAREAFRQHQERRRNRALADVLHPPGPTADEPGERPGT